MEGKILDYNSQSQMGLIRGNDGNRYEFSAEEYRSQAEIRVGQTVDFEVDGKKATGVYLLKGNVATLAGAATESLSGITNSEAMSKLTQTAGSLVGQENVDKVTRALQGGIQNLPGVVVSGVAVLTLFLPSVLQIFNTPTGLISGGIGILSFLLLLGLGYLFYTGAKRTYTKILAGVTAGLMWMGLYGLLDPLRKAEEVMETARSFGAPVSEPSFFDFAQFGFYAVVAATFALLFLAFVGSYKEKA
ncbi:MAG: hypothetical protein LVT47_09875 [Cyanobacteria bacterium LVE1205-1]